MSPQRTLAGLAFALLGCSAYAADSDRLDMNAADSTLNAPSMVDSRFVVQASRVAAAALSQARAALRYSDRPVVQNAARETAFNCKRIGLALASLERQKGWTLPPPAAALYGPTKRHYSDASYLAAQSDNERTMIVLYGDAETAARDNDVRALVKRELPKLQQQLDSLNALRTS